MSELDYLRWDAGPRLVRRAGTRARSRRTPATRARPGWASALADGSGDLAFSVRCDGGIADGWGYSCFIEPPEAILVLPDPLHQGRFLRVIHPWPEATPYRRTGGIDRVPTELVYRPMEVASCGTESPRTTDV